ncbi:MAG: PD40 domain-containing protein [Anaerolineales bacterium]|nr:PD40 domain-containing protein [Anaerolineales bacterium]
MDKKIFAHPREIFVLCYFLVFLVSCNQLTPQETPTFKPDITTLTPTQSSSSSPIPTKIYITPVKTMVLGIGESTEINAPSSTQSPTQRPIIEIPKVDIQELITSDLLFLSLGSLMHWDSDLGLVTPVIEAPESDLPSEPLASLAMTSGSILKYSADTRFKIIALSRSKGISANGVELFDLAVFDVDYGELITLIDETPRIYQFSISPDGKWVAYTLHENVGQIYAIRTNGVGGPIEIGTYEAEDEWKYSQIAWSPDSRSVVWSDASGVWVSNPEEPHPRQILSDTLEVKDFHGDNSNIRVMYTSLAWSPVGRYILSKIQPYQSTVQWQGIIDTRRGHISEVPGSYEFRDPAASANWIQDGYLLVVYGSNAEENRSPSLKTLRVVPTRDDLIIHEEEFLFRPEQFVEFSKDLRDQTELLLDLPTQINKWNQSFVLKSPKIGIQPILFKFDKKSGSLIAIGEIPFDTISVDWSPDGDSALLRGQHGSVLVILAEKPQVIDIGTAWELDPCCINWLPVDISDNLDRPQSN